MPIEIRRFGVGHRRPDGPPGTTGVSGQAIHVDGRGTIGEVALARGARIEPHTSPNTTWFVVIEGGGYVLVGEEERRVAAGEAVLWPAGIPHGARTEYGPMRAFAVEFAGSDDSHLRVILEGIAKRLGPGEAGAVERGEGRLAMRPATPARDSEGEPT
jgi:quercetin dioxygenase-like cupin family protein